MKMGAAQLKLAPFELYASLVLLASLAGFFSALGQQHSVAAGWACLFATSLCGVGGCIVHAITNCRRLALPLKRGASPTSGAGVLTGASTPSLSWSSNRLTKVSVARRAVPPPSDQGC